MSARVKQRFEVKPGLTGLAQVHEHDEITWEERFAYDVLYVHRKKLMLDVIIAGKTVVRIVKELGNNEPKKQITEYMRE
jgi:lipopolysaccharide/colanic/teichoic acid biosynthesis glycosyltransferase